MGYALGGGASRDVEPMSVNSWRPVALPTWRYAAVAVCNYRRGGPRRDPFIITFRHGRSAGIVAHSRESAADALYYYLAADQTHSILSARRGVLLGDPTYRDADMPFWRPLLGRVDTSRAQSALRQTLVDFYPSQIVADLPDNPYSVIYSADGRVLYAALPTGTVNVYTPDDADALRWRRGYATKGASWSLALSPDGRWLAAGGDNTKAQDGVVGLLNLDSGAWAAWLEVSTPKEIHDDVYAVAFSPDGYYLAPAAATTPGGAIIQAA